jgi:hypothetical protein
MKTQEPERVWIIQRCIDAWTNHYEDWPGYCEPMNREDMMAALKACDDKWPAYEFRGHNINYASQPCKRGEYPKPLLHQSR